MTDQILHASGDTIVALEEGIKKDVALLLDKIVWGTEATKYLHLNTLEHIANLKGVKTISIRRNENLLACMVLSFSEFDSCYIRYFAVSKDFKGRGLPVIYGGKGFLKLIQSIDYPLILNAVVEKNNTDSYKIVQSFDFKCQGDLKTIGFSRFNPKMSKDCFVLREEEKAEMQSLLGKEYLEFVNYSQKYLYDTPYYVLKRDGKIVAGAQLYIAHWRVVSMPGLSGWIIQNILPKLPLLKKFYNPHDFRFLSIDQLYVNEKYPEAFSELTESILAHQKMNTVIFWVDEKWNKMKKVLEKNKLGIIHLFVKDSKAKIMFKVLNNTKTEGKNYYVSANDVL